MNGHELAELIDLRWHTLRKLLDIGAQQLEAIEAARMSGLMQLLSDKQTPLNDLQQITQRLRAASDDNPEERLWESPSQRESCRCRQDECEQMYLDLLALEAECETALQKSRTVIQQRLDRVDAGREAANRYANHGSNQSRGGKLDLSSQ